MPRKTRIYWITKPTNLNKCHSRRCEKSAIRDRLCGDHWTTWQMEGFEPAMPESYSGIVQHAEPPLKQELNAKVAELDDAINLIASIATDDESSPEQIAATLAVLKAEKDKTRAKKRESLAPFVTAHKRTNRWFKPVQKKLDQAIQLAEQRLATARSTVHDLAPGGRRKNKAG